MHASPHLPFDLSQLRTHSISTGHADKEKFSVSIGASTDVSESKEDECLRLSKSSLGTVVRRKAAELDQAGLIRMQR